MEARCIAYRESIRSSCWVRWVKSGWWRQPRMSCVRVIGGVVVVSACSLGALVPGQRRLLMRVGGISVGVCAWGQR